MNTPNQMKKIEIVITADVQTGQVQVRGPLAHKMLCIKALVTAQQIVIDHAPPVIQVPIAPSIVPAKNGGTH